MKYQVGDIIKKTWSNGSFIIGMIGRVTKGSYHWEHIYINSHSQYTNSIINDGDIKLVTIDEAMVEAI